MTISVPDIVAFTESAGKSFVSKLKANISSRFGSQDVIAAFSIFDPKKVPSIDSPDIKTYGESSINTLHSHFGVPRAAKTLDGVECTKEPIVSDETIIECSLSGRTIDILLLSIRNIVLVQNFKR